MAVSLPKSRAAVLTTKIAAFIAVSFVEDEDSLGDVGSLLDPQWIAPTRSGDPTWALVRRARYPKSNP